MALTRSFKDTVLACVRSDPEFRDALLTEGVNALLEGDVDTGKTILRDYIKVTVGFETLAAHQVCQLSHSISRDSNYFPTP